MAIYDFFLSRNNNSTVADYIGHTGRLFFDPAERVLRISDGTTAGGEVFNGIVTVANTEPTDNFQGQIWLDPETFELNVYHNGNFIPTIDIATSSTIGGVKLGPGVTTNGSGQIIIDSSGLDFSFGDLASTTGTYTDESDYAILSTINTNEDLILASNGTGGVHVVGEFRVHKTNTSTTHALEATPVFEIKADGQVKILVPAQDVSTGSVSIIGSTTGQFISPVNTGVMLHITGNLSNPGIPSRIYNDSQNAFSAFVARRFNGTVASPTAVLADEEIMRLSGTAHNGTIIPGVANQRIVYVARGNQTTSNQGGAIELWATPINTTTIAKIATVDSVGITLESGKVLTGNVTGTVTTATFAQSFNTSTLVANAVTAVQAGTVTTAAQPAITSVGTLTSLTVSGSISDGIGNVRSIAIRNTATSYVLTAADNGQIVSITTGSVTVNTGVFASPFGQTVSIYNNTVTSMSIIAGAGVTLRLAGTLSTGTRTLARYGVATMICVASNTFVVSGAGLS
jgi:hypothetical protein